MEQEPIGCLQEKATPLWRHDGGGYHLNRDTLAMMREVGLKAERVEHY